MQRIIKKPLKPNGFRGFWSEWRDSNSRHPGPKPGALPTGPHPDTDGIIHEQEKKSNQNLSASREKTEKGRPFGRPFFSQQGQYKGKNNGGQQACHHQGEAGCGAGQVADGCGTGGADDMAGGAEGHALGHGVCDPENFAPATAQNIGQDAGDDDHSGGDGGQAAAHFTQGRADGGGDGFGQHGHDQCAVDSGKQAPQQHHTQAADGAGGNADHNCGQIAPQGLKMLVHGNGQTHGTGGQQPGHFAHTCLIIGVFEAAQDHESKNQHHSDEGGIGDGGPQLLLEQQADLVSAQGDEDGQNADGKKLSHDCHPAFRKVPG